MPSPIWRSLVTAIFLICTGLVGYALYLQHAQGLEPCPLCILQRYAFVALGLVALAAALHNPKRAGRWFYAVLLFLLTVAGGAIAGRHSWLQGHPDPFAGCGPGLAYTLDNFPLGKALPMIFQGSGPCSAVDWRFWGLSMPVWALIFFAALAFVTLWLAGSARR